MKSKNFFLKKLEAKCVWYGECGPSFYSPGYNLNCKYTGDPVHQTDSDFLALFRDLCPHLYNESNTATCCDQTQLKQFKVDIDVLRQLLSKCPACFTNFKTFLCDLNCHPNQADFLLVTREIPYTPQPYSFIKESSSSLEKEEENSDEYQIEANENEDIVPTPTMEIVELTYHITNLYANNFYNSCQYL